MCHTERVESISGSPDEGRVSLWGTSKNPSFPRKRESSSVFLLGPRLRGDDESTVFRGGLSCSLEVLSQEHDSHLDYLPPLKRRFSNVRFTAIVQALQSSGVHDGE
jgi:hypothetical protein